MRNERWFTHGHGYWSLSRNRLNRGRIVPRTFFFSFDSPFAIVTSLSLFLSTYLLHSIALLINSTGQLFPRQILSRTVLLWSHRIGAARRGSARLSSRVTADSGARTRAIFFCFFAFSHSLYTYRFLRNGEQTCTYAYIRTVSGKRFRNTYN